MKYLTILCISLFHYFDMNGLQNCPDPKNMTSCKVIIPNRRLVLQGKPDSLVSKFTVVRKRVRIYK
ncbi:hypothetical protein [Aquirufa ecclesiirivi]|uniref:hypothetical protein n=1 Tax=Aquirufa ecclesiirivi TaxID=2715124 RepID=UPI00140A4816|nr:hypothetical protein [Aquirufa ecclesiirivi]MCZ2471366.1 hypothetical protein [Aquirufa ecclesiirivi]NHC49879.1 hypothetical protein [Aquirufa ecclesiirivi]